MVSEGWSERVDQDAFEPHHLISPSPSIQFSPYIPSLLTFLEHIYIMVQSHHNEILAIARLGTLLAGFQLMWDTTRKY